jgi:hypothetical protein
VRLDVHDEVVELAALVVGVDAGDPEGGEEALKILLEVDGGPADLVPGFLCEIGEV